MTQLQGFFEKNFTLSPDYCGASARMSPLAVFTMFQAIAAEHAERIGVGGAAMARRGAFWLTLHSRVDFFRWPALAQEVTAATWPEHCEGDPCAASAATACGREISCWRWAAPSGRCWGRRGGSFPLPSLASRRISPLVEREGITEAPARFRDDLLPEELVQRHTVRSTDIDMGRHMNNVAYVRLLLDCFPPACWRTGRSPP